MDNVSPEEKLLKLIRTPKKEAPDAAPEVKSAPAPVVTPVVAARVPSSAGVSVRNPKPAVKISAASLWQRYSSFLNIRKVIISVFVISSILLVVSLIYPFLSLAKIKPPQVTQELIKDDKLETKEEIKPYEFYAQEIKGKQIFATSSGQDTDKPAAAASADLVKDISLVGIISGENPQAIIEDKKAQKSFYLTKGQSIGELQIEEIHENKIILNHQGKRYELYL